MYIFFFFSFFQVDPFDTTCFQNCVVLTAANKESSRGGGSSTGSSFNFSSGDESESGSGRERGGVYNHTGGGCPTTPCPSEILGAMRGFQTGLFTSVIVFIAVVMVNESYFFLLFPVSFHNNLLLV